MRQLFAAPLVMILALSSAGHAEIVDFETGSLSDAGIFTEGNVSVAVNNFTGGNVLLGQSYNAGNNTTVFGFCAIDGNCTPGTSLSVTTGNPFSISSFDAANFQPGDVTGQITAVGTLAKGGTVTQTFNLDNSWQTYTLSGFNDVTSVNLASSGSYAGDVDNLAINTGSVSAAPEPATWAMMILGLGMVGGVTYRQRRQNVTTRVAFAAA